MMNQQKQNTSSTSAEFHVTSNRIAASAGTGKTYQLASRYITLLLLGAKPEEIIALTFTRKAAGEFRNRILHALAEGADDKRDKKTGRNELAVRVWDVLSGLSVVPTEYGPWEVVPASNPIPLLPVTEAIVRLAAESRQYPEELYNGSEELQAYYQFRPATAATFADLLKDMVTVLSKLQLSTIDSFFSTLVSTNSLELGMNNVTPVDPTEEANIRTQDVLRYLDSKNKDEGSRADFLAMFSHITGGVGNTTQSRIEADVKAFLHLYRELPHTQWGNISTFSGGKNFRLATDEEMETYRHAAAELNELLTLHGSELLKDRALGQLKALANGALELKRESKAVMKNVPEGSNSQNPLSRIARLANTLLELAVPFKLRNAADRSANLQKLIADYAKIYDTRMKAEGRLTFNDISRMAQELMLRDEADEHLLRHHIAYRMGGKLAHWMLDEFQDTSESQFSTLTPLLQPIAEEAGGNTFDFSEERWTAAMPPELRDKLTPGRRHAVARESMFIVGDTKQSIYGFRTGKTDVFERLASEEPWKTPLQPSPLQRSFRSSPVIMDFTNQLFTALEKVECPEIAADGCIETAPVTFSADFTKHSSAKNIPGYVEMCFVPPPDKNEEEDASMKTRIFDKIVDVLKKLTVNEESPKNGMSIAILVRSNSDADEIQNHLRDSLPNLRTVLVKDSLAAVACPMGEMLLYFFKWLLHPGDEAALSVARASFLGEHIGRDTAISHAEWLQELQNIGFLGVVHKLLTTLPAEDADSNQAIIRCWENEALSFDTSGGSLADWVLHMKNLSVQAAGAAGAVQIMTMHKSKGLEFDAVILPYIGVKSTDSVSDIKYFISEDNQSFLLPPGGKDDWSYFGSTFTDLATQWQHQQRKEAYNLLYVAITRAKHANYIICHGAKLMELKENKNTGVITKSWKAPARSVGGLLRQACALMKPEEQLSLGTLTEEQIFPLMGEAQWYESMENKTAAAAESTTPATLGAGIPRRKRVNPSTLASAEDKKPQEAEEKPSRAATPSTSARGGADFGTAVHEAWEQVEWLTGQELPYSAPLNDEQAVVNKALQQADVAALFTRQAGQVAYNEQSVEAINDTNEWVSAVIDRLVLTHDDTGQVVAAHIIDFKTNRPVPRDGYTVFKEWLMAHYAGQMLGYRELISAAFSLPHEAITLSLVSCPSEGTAQVLTYTEKKLQGYTQQ